MPDGEDTPMAQPLVDTVLINARAIIADRRRRLRGAEAVTADGRECDACDDDGLRFCAVGALIRSAYISTGDRELAHRLGPPPDGSSRPLPRYFFPALTLGT